MGLRVVGFCLLLVTMALFWLLNRPEPHAAATPGRDEKGNSPQPPRRAVEVVHADPEQSRTEVELGRTLLVSDAATKEPLDAVSVYEVGTIKKAYRASELRLVGLTPKGVMALKGKPTYDQEPGGLGEDILCCRPGYLPAAVTIPWGPGAYTISMRRGRMISANVTDMEGQPLTNAKVVFFVGNLDLSLLTSKGDDVSLGEMVPADEGSNWYTEVACDGDGVATAVAPEAEVLAVAVARGWFMPASQVKYHGRSAIQNLEPESQTIFMEEVKVGIVKIDEGSVGMTLMKLPGKWRRSNSSYARMVEGQASMSLGEEFPGALVFALAILDGAGSKPGIGHPSGASIDREPEVAFTTLDKLGRLVDVRCKLRPYSRRQLDSAFWRNVKSEGVSSGTLSVQKATGFPETVESPLVCIVQTPDRQQISVGLWYGRDYELPCGKHQVFMRRLGMTGRTHFADVDIIAGKSYRLDSPGVVDLQWPVTLCVAYPDGTAPAFCNIQVKAAQEEGTAPPISFSPIDSRAYQVFLKPGMYDITVSTGPGSQPVTYRSAVGIQSSSVMLRIPW